MGQTVAQSRSEISQDLPNDGVSGSAFGSRDEGAKVYISNNADAPRSSEC
jgi:hypothetical protein